MDTGGPKKKTTVSLAGLTQAAAQEKETEETEKLQTCAHLSFTGQSLSSEE